MYTFIFHSSSLYITHHGDSYWGKHPTLSLDRTTGYCYYTYIFVSLALIAIHISDFWNYVLAQELLIIKLIQYHLRLIQNLSILCIEISCKSTAKHGKVQYLGVMDITRFRCITKSWHTFTVPSWATSTGTKSYQRNNTVLVYDHPVTRTTVRDLGRLGTSSRRGCQTNVIRLDSRMRSIRFPCETPTQARLIWSHVYYSAVDQGLPVQTDAIRSIEWPHLHLRSARWT